MKATTIDTVLLNNAYEKIEKATEEVKAVKYGLIAKTAAAVKFFFAVNEAAPYALGLSPMMEARLFL